MGRFRRGWELTKRSWAALRSHPTLLRFPLIGMLATLIPLALLVLPGIYLLDTHEEAPGIALLAVGLYASSVVGIYVGVALAGAADAVFHGREGEANTEGWRLARSRPGAIAGWALVSTVLGVIFSALESQRGLAQIVGALVGAAWAFVTFLAVPVIAIEGTGPVETIRRCAHLLRERWAGQITGNVAIGGAVALLGILPAVGLIALGIILWANDGNGADVALGAVLVGIGAILLALAVMLQSALKGVFGVALYRYAAGGEVSGPFSSEELESAVRQRA
jgi:hypothetical protein